MLDALLRAVIRAYPAEFRTRFGAEMLEQTQTSRPNSHLTPSLGRRRAAWLVWDAARHLPEAYRLTFREGHYGLFGEAVQSLRRILRSPADTGAVAVLVILAVGIVTAALAYGQAVLRPGLGLPDESQLVILESEGQWSRADVEMLDRGLPEVELVYFNGWGHSLVGVGDAIQLRGALTSSNYFEVLGVRPGIGRLFLPADGLPGAEPVVVISHELWLTHFGADTAAIGRILDFRSTFHTSARLVGVLPRHHQPLEPDWKVWTADRSEAGSDWADRRFRNALGRRRSDRADRGDLAQLTNAIATLPERRERGASARWVSLRHWRFGDLEQGAELFALAALAVLGMAMANVVMIQNARQLTRLGDAATRIALGASARRVAVGIAVDSCLPVLLGAVGGIGLGHFLISLAPHWLPGAEQIRTHLEVDWRVTAGAAGLAVVSGLLVALAVVRRSVRLGLGRSIASARGGLSRRWATTLVGVQVGATLAITFLSSLLFASIANLSRVDPGFDPGAVLSMYVYASGDEYAEPETATALCSAIEAAVETIPGVLSVGSSHTLPLTRERWSLRVWRADRPDTASANYRMVSLGFFESLELALIDGRLPDAAEPPSDEIRVVLNRRLAAPLGLEGRLPALVESDLGTLRVVGVVENSLQHDLASVRGPEALVLAEDLPWPVAARYLTISADRSQLATSEVRQVLTAVDADLAVSRIVWLDDVASASISQVTQLSLLLFGLALAALLLGALGVWGSAAQAARARRREFGLRCALGATSAQLATHAMAPIGRILAVGCTVGGVLGLLGLSLISAQFYGLSDSRSLTASIVGAALLMTITVAVVAAWVPARSASRLDPMTSLRAD